MHEHGTFRQKDYAQCFLRILWLKFEENICFILKLLLKKAQWKTSHFVPRLKIKMLQYK